MSRRNDFLNQAAPENYVAGLGRGATGFTTRSDLGPAREGPSEDQMKEMLAKRAKQLEENNGAGFGEKKPDENDDEDRYQDPENEVGLFASGNYDRDDDEADRIYQDVDEKMDRRRKQRRSVNLSKFFPLSKFLHLVEQITDVKPVVLLGKLENNKNEKNTNATIQKYNSNSLISSEP